MRALITEFVSVVLIAASGTLAAQTTTVTNSGNGAANYVPYYTGSAALSANSPISVSGSKIGIGTSSPSQTLTIFGTLSSSGHAALGTATVDSIPNALTVWPTGPGILTFQDTLTSVPNSSSQPSGILGELDLNPSGNASNVGYNAMSLGIATNPSSTQPIGGMTGAYLPVYLESNTNAGQMGGISTDVEAWGGSQNIVNSMSGLSSFLYLGGGTTVTNQYGINLQSPGVDGVATNNYGAYIAGPNGGGSIVNNYGLYIEDQSHFGSASKFNIYSQGAGLNYFSGSVGIGTASPTQLLEVNGAAKVDGALTVSSGGILFPGNSTPQTTPWTGVVCGGDYAESVNVTGDRKLFVAGDVLVIDPEHPGKFLKSDEAYSTGVTGVYSTRPGVVGRRQKTPQSPDEVPMAMTGIVPTKVTAENGPIHPGDLLVSSSKVGYAMKGTDRSRMMGAVIGKALGSLNSGTGTIEMVVTLQ